MERNLERLVGFAKTLFTGQRIDVIVEVGARDCRETAGLREAFPEAKIIAFECNPRTLPLCRSAVAAMQGVQLIEKAVSDRTGTVEFFPVELAHGGNGLAQSNPGASSLFRSSDAHQYEHYEQSRTTVEATTLARVMAELALSHIDLLWMDIQGAELLALKGLGEKLAEVALIHAEVEFVELYQGQPLCAEVVSYLDGRGFSLAGFTIYSKHSGDAVFVNRRRFGSVAILRAIWQHRLLLRKRLLWLRHRLKRAVLGRV